MAYFHRLIFCLCLGVLSWLPTSSFASFPASKLWINSYWPGQYESYLTPRNADLNSAIASNSSCGFTITNATNNGLTGAYDIYAATGCGNSSSHRTETAIFSCPAGSTGSGSGASTVCTCNSPSYESNGACVSPSPTDCPGGSAITQAVSIGWFKPDDQVGIYSAQKAVSSQCVSTGGKTCTVNYTGSNAPPMGVPGVNGYSLYTSYLTGTTSGGSQCSPPISTTPSEPACAGQVGTYNGVRVCLAVESQASKDARAAQVASDAAAAARQAAINAGRTAAVADQAAAAAGSAAAQASRNGSTASQSAAAGAAAGAAAATAAAGGASSSSTMTQGSAAGAGQAAADRATAVATAAGLSPTLVTQAASSASAAASIAAAQVLNNGGTVAQANAAAAAAGQASTASIIYGSTPSVAGDAGAAAAAGKLAGATNGTGSGNTTTTGTGQSAPQDPVGDFCTKNPQAQMCKRTPDSSFGGACGSPPVCEGDAVMCAVAKATFATNCFLTPPAPGGTPLYDAAITKTGDQTGDLPGNSTVSISPADFNRDNFLGAQTGMHDVTISVMGSTVVLPFSSVNVWLARLGVILQACTLILCARIVSRG